MAAKKPTPKVGEIRIGRAGNKYNKWDGKRWVPVSAARTGAGSGQKATVASKPVKRASAKAVSAAKKGDAKQAEGRAAMAKATAAKKTASKNQSPAARVRESIANMRINTKADKKKQEAYLSRYGTTQGGKRIK